MTVSQKTAIVVSATRFTLHFYFARASAIALCICVRAEQSPRGGMGKGGEVEREEEFLL